MREENFKSPFSLKLLAFGGKFPNERNLTSKEFLG